MKELILYIVKYVKCVYFLYYYIGTFFLRILSCFVKTDDKLILFISFGGRKFDDSPKAIYDMMLNDRRYNDYQIVWAFRKPDNYNIPRGIIVKCDTLKYYIIALKARVWITNSSVERGLSFKGKNTFYFDTWHGTPIKKMGSDVLPTSHSFSSLGKWPVDYFTCQGDFEADVFGRVFRTVGRDKMHVIGLPRNDIYAKYTKEYLLGIRNKLGLGKHKKVVLYAPTYREFEKTKSMTVQNCIPIQIDKLRNELGKDFVLLFRSHYEVAKSMNIKDDEFIRDVSNYPLLEDLMIASDILVSDYSSIFFDFSIMHKPMLAFCYDYERYSAERGMYFDIREYLPNACDDDELIYLIKNYNSPENVQKSISFQQKFVTAFGDATSKSLDVIALELGI